MYKQDLNCTAFCRHKIIGTGALKDVVEHVHAYRAQHPAAQIDIYAQESGAYIELDLRGDLSKVMARLIVDDMVRPPTPPAPLKSKSAGRPKLGVVGKEVTLLPRHWAWLKAQKGGASVALRKMVEREMRGTAQSQHKKKAQEVTYKIMTAVAGDLPHYEEAVRALFAGDAHAFRAHIELWPDDLRLYFLGLSKAAF